MHRQRRGRARQRGEGARPDLADRAAHRRGRHEGRGRASPKPCTRARATSFRSSNPARLQAVMARELRSFRLERALETTLKSARDARRQLETVLERSNDAIVQVQEGIVVEANASWLELFGLADGGALVGTPVMDLFEESTHAALKGALAACLQGRWSDHTLTVNAVLADGTSLPIELVLALGEHDGEPCVRLVVPARPRDDRHARGRSRRRRASRSVDRPALPPPASGSTHRAAVHARHRRRALLRAGEARQVREHRARRGRRRERRMPGRIRRRCSRNT